MDIVYSFINFFILAAILYFAGRKLVVRIFRQRRESVYNDLALIGETESILRKSDEIAAAEEAEAKAEAEEIRNEAAASTKARTDALNATAMREREALDREETRLRLGLRVEMQEELKKSIIEKARDAALRLMAEEPYVTAFRAKEREIAEAILGKITVTPGDIAYLTQKDVLYVTLTSTFPLDPALTDEIGAKATALVEKAGGKISYWVQTDESLVGGLRLRIGDTVYDGTISDLLYRMTRVYRNKNVEGEFSAAKLVDMLIEGVRGAKLDIGVYQLGRVVSVSDGICWLDGLADIMYGEVVEFTEKGERGMILSIEPGKIGCVIFGRYEHIEAGDRVRRVRRMASVPVGDEILGRVVDPLGASLDGYGTIRTANGATRPIECPAPTILQRQPVSVPMHTGIKAIDSLIPIGRGQRELIAGDRQTGKTAIAVDAIINQKGKNVVCIYVAVGQKDTAVAELYSRLKKHGAMEYTVIVCADAYSSASMQYIAPFAGTAMGEHFMYSGRDVLIIYDDLSKHAVAYREISLLFHRPSGREAYPGDVFYLHSRLLERSARLSAQAGGGSMTAIPIIETQAGDISAYIPTNVISITDGQIFLESGLFNAGQRPAVNVGLSVSRVGGAAQKPFMKKISGSLRMRLAQYRELESFAQFGSDIDEVTRKTIESGERIMAALNQPRYEPLSDEFEALIIFAVSEGCADTVSPENMAAYQAALFDCFATSHKDLLDIIASDKKPSAEDIGRVKAAVCAFTEAYR